MYDFINDGYNFRGLADRNSKLRTVRYGTEGFGHDASRYTVLWRFLFCGFTNGIDTKVYGPVAGSLCGQHSFQDTKNSSS